MPDPSTYRPAPGTIPESPGVYRFRDTRGTVIYVGEITYPGDCVRLNIELIGGEH